jgi:membrane protease YdiL (CAAX protease family)
VEPASANSVPEPRRAIVREVLVAFAIATALCAILFALRNLHPFLAANLTTAVAVVFWLLPMRMLERKGREARDYGLRLSPIGRNVLWMLGAMVVVFPLFLVGFRVYYHVLCGVFAKLPLCLRYAPSRWRAMGVQVAPRFWLVAAAQLVVVAIPEEFFFRGYIQGRLRETFRPVPAIALSSILFGLGHFLVDYDPQRLAVAFPGVLFGILRERTGSIAPGAVFHAGCNLYIDTLHRTFFG